MIFRGAYNCSTGFINWSEELLIVEEVCILAASFYLLTSSLISNLFLISLKSFSMLIVWLSSRFVLALSSDDEVVLYFFGHLISRDGWPKLQIKISYKQLLIFNNEHASIDIAYIY